MAKKTFVVTSKINAGYVQQGMSVLIEKRDGSAPNSRDITKAFEEQKGIKGTTATHSTSNFNIMEVK